MKRFPLLLSAFSALSLTGSHAALISFEFETNGVTEGWGHSAPGPNGFGTVSGFTATTDVDGNVGVLTSSDINIDPQLTLGTVALPSGDTWSSVTIRFRQLNDDPQDGGDGAAYTTSGQLLFFNGTTANRTPGPTGISTQSYAGTGAYAADSYSMTVTQEDAVDFWQVMTLDLTAAPILNSGNITGVRFDPIGNNADGNFEVDYVRFNSIPEPGSALLSLLGLSLLGLRRR